MIVLYINIMLYANIKYVNILLRDAFGHTRVRATHPRVHSRTRDTYTHSRHNRTCGNQKTTRFIKRTENFILNYQFKLQL